MFLLTILLAIIAIGLTYMYAIGKKSMREKTDSFTKYDAGVIFIWIGVVFGIISLLINFNNYSSQIRSFEKARKVQQKINIYQSRYADLSAVFTKHLAEEYPAIEKEITSISSMNGTAGKILPGGQPIQLIVQRYPELKSSVTLMKLVDEIKRIADGVYAEKLGAQGLYEIIRYRAQNPWILLKPAVPDDIYGSVYSK